MDFETFFKRFVDALKAFDNHPRKDISDAALCVHQAGLPVVERHKIAHAILIVAAYPDILVDHMAIIENSWKQTFPWWRRIWWKFIHLLEQEALIPDPPANLRSRD